MIRGFIVFSIFCIFLFAQADKKVYFKGNKQLSSQYLYENLNLVIQKSWYEFYKDATPKIDKVIVTPLKESLVKLYKSEGFFKVRVDDMINDQNITFIIKENKPIKVVDINYSSDYDIKKYIKFKIGDRFRVKKFISIRKDIRQELEKQGYCNYDLNTKAFVDLDRYYVRLVYRLKKNKKCRFGKIDITTPKNISKKVIFSRLTYKEGDFYSSKKLLRSYENIMGLDAFDNINIKQVTKGNKIQTYISVSPKKVMIRREIGIGYETKYGAKTFFHWEQRNFKGDARKLSFDLKYSENEKYIKNSFFNPALLKVPFFYNYFDFKNEFLFSKTTYDRFYENKYSDIIHIQKDFDRYSLDFGLDIERIFIEKRGDYCFINDGGFLLFSPFIKAILDHRDSKIDPKNGIYLSTYWENGLRYLASSTSYTKLFLEGRSIKTIKDFTIALKGKIGFIKEFDKTLPESKLFFAGGSYSNRAYGYNSLGAFDGNCSDIGGKSIVDNSLEVSYPLTKKISLALFWDATMISTKELYFNLDFIHSYGVGVRYKTLIGPVKIDYAVNAKDSSIYAIHFQIGQSY